MIWNPWHGCRKYSEGCEHCYMYYLDACHGQDGSRIYRVSSDFSLPVKKHRNGEYVLAPGTSVRVCMTSDFFLEEADEWRGEVWNMIRNRPDLSFWLQTKRIHRVRDHLPPDFETSFRHVQFCVTAENEKRAQERLPVLMTLPFRQKHVMCAPLLSDIDLSPWLVTGEIDSVLADGENYAGARPCRYEWVEHLYRQCEKYDTPFHFIGTGNRFVKDGKEYPICKAYQRTEALRSGLQYPPVPKPDIQKRCAKCSRKNVCRGCTWCGRCQEKKDYSALSAKEEDIL